jgi:hypothetical protein
MLSDVLIALDSGLLPDHTKTSKNLLPHDFNKYNELHLYSETCVKPQKPVSGTSKSGTPGYASAPSRITLFPHQSTSISGH